MADYTSLQFPKENYRQPTSSIFTSPRLFTTFVSKNFSDNESIISPTSILDFKPFSSLKTPFWSDSNTPKTPPKQESKNLWEKMDSRGVSLGLIEALTDDKPSPNLFGSQLKIQAPPLPPPVHSPTESPKSPTDFGIKTRHSHLGSFSPSKLRKSPSGSQNSGAFSSLSAIEMELSEDYTRVVSYGPNPKTIHIFDDCIVESCCGVVKFSESRKENGFLSHPSDTFLSFCYSCSKNLGQGNDIYMYRGEMAFCSSECRRKEMMLEGEEETQGDDARGGRGRGRGRGKGDGIFSFRRHLWYLPALLG